MKRPRGTGSVYRRKDGYWVAAIQVEGRRLVRYAKTRKEAYRLLDELRAQWPARPAALTLGAYLVEWLGVHQANLRPTTAGRYADLLAHVPPELKALNLGEVTPVHLAALYRQLLSRLRPGTIRLLHTALHRALEDAVNWGLLPQNPASKVKPPKGEPYRPALWTPEEVQRFLAAALRPDTGSRYNSLFAFLLASGMRLGEALALRWSDIDFERGVVQVTKSLATVRGRWVEGPPKTKSSVRTIALPSWCLELLRGLKAQAGSVRVFTNTAGAPPTHSALRQAFLRLLSRLKLRPIRIHDLRVLHASLLALAGVPVKVTQERLGHASPLITLQVYTRVLGDADRLAAQALDKLAEGERLMG